ncbi:MAG TPA: hypothetical protein VFT22_04655 [Kofleriaceae bacterium]|nr:hypothetical protein [Kofleriaceae bacterium]
MRRTRSDAPAARSSRPPPSHLRALRVTIWILLTALAGCPAPAPPPPPGPAPLATPELYGVGLFTTGAWDFFVAFMPDQRRALFCRADDHFRRYEIFETRLGADGRWTPPVKPRFAARWSNADPRFDVPRDDAALRGIGSGKTGDIYRVPMAALGG